MFLVLFNIVNFKKLSLIHNPMRSLLAGLVTNNVFVKVRGPHQGCHVCCFLRRQQTGKDQLDPVLKSTKKLKIVTVSAFRYHLPKSYLMFGRHRSECR
jgi:hypothetical protein